MPWAQKYQMPPCSLIHADPNCVYDIPAKAAVLLDGWNVSYNKSYVYKNLRGKYYCLEKDFMELIQELTYDDVIHMSSYQFDFICSAYNLSGYSLFDMNNFYDVTEHVYHNVLCVLEYLYNVRYHPEKSVEHLAHTVIEYPTYFFHSLLEKEMYRKFLLQCDSETRDRLILIYLVTNPDEIDEDICMLLSPQYPSLLLPMLITSNYDMWTEDLQHCIEHGLPFVGHIDDSEYSVTRYMLDRLDTLLNINQELPCESELIIG